MTKINCIIADDEVLARNVIKSHIEKIDSINIAGFCANGLEVYTAIKNTNVDLLFLDIQMPQLTGIELLRTIKNPPSVIITTAYSEFAVEGYELNVVDYLLKPISFERFLKAIDKYETLFNSGNKNTGHIFSTEKEDPADTFIYVKADRKMVKIFLKDILYIEGLKDYVKINTLEKQVITNHTLTYFEEKLPENNFIRVHRSFIIASRFISAFTATEITINKTAIPIGNTYAREVIRKLNDIR